MLLSVAFKLYFTTHPLTISSLATFKELDELSTIVLSSILKEVIGFVEEPHIIIEFTKIMSMNVFSLFEFVISSIVPLWIIPSK